MTRQSQVPWFTVLEFSLSGLCNRTCAFCPRADPKVYPNVNEYIDSGLYGKLMSELREQHYTGAIVYSGFSEPTLHPKLPEFVRLARSSCPQAFIEVKTDGDFLNVEKVGLLFDSGLSRLNVSVYDGPEARTRFEKLRDESGIDDSKFIMRDRFLGPEDNFGLVLSNRAGMVSPTVVSPLASPLKRNCYYPFYIVMVDHLGDVLLCPHDWGKKLVVGNLENITMADAWTSPVMQRVRRRLADAVRDFAPCNVCSVNGMLQGRESFETWREHWGRDEEPTARHAP